MSTIETADQAVHAVDEPHKVIHPIWVRVTHWINALAMLI
jgi:Ni,Fe-hydrogenase I cytochrome b subunit